MSNERYPEPSQLEELRRQLRCVKDALAFYADPRHWLCEGEGTLLSRASLAETDRGACAQQVLESLHTREAALRSQAAVRRAFIRHRTGDAS